MVSAPGAWNPAVHGTRHGLGLKQTCWVGSWRYVQNMTNQHSSYSMAVPNRWRDRHHFEIDQPEFGRFGMHHPSIRLHLRELSRKVN